MGTMERADIERIVYALDGGVPRENAKVRLDMYGNDFDQSFITATENGYLRLGVEFLKAGLVPYKDLNGPQPHAIDVEIDQIVRKDSDIRFVYFERREDFTVETSEEDFWRDSLVIWVVIAVLVLIPILAIVGLVTVIRALF